MSTAATSPGQTSTAPRKQHLGLLFAGLMVVMLLASLSQTILSTALPTIVGDLGGVNHMSWVITAYILASTVMMPVYGRISDQLGRKPVLIGAVVLFIIGSGIGAMAATMPWLIAARVVQGLGGGGLMILSQTSIADVVPARERGKYMGVMGSVFAVSSVAGPLLGGWLTEGPGWRWAFTLNIPLGILAILALLAFMRLPPIEKDSTPVDYLGMIFLALATTALILVCTWGGGEYEWGSPQIIGLIAAMVVAAIAFVITESRATAPVVPLKLFRDRNFTLTTVAGLMVGVAMFGTIGYMPTYIQMVKGVDATTAGLLMTPMMASLLIASVLSGALVSRTGRYKYFPVVGLAIMSVGLWLISSLTVDDSTVKLGVYISIFGIGIGLSMQILVLIVQNSFPHNIVGTATAASNYFRQVGATVGSAVVGSVFVSRLQDLLSQNMPHLPPEDGSGAAAGMDANSFTPSGVHQLPDVLREPIVQSYNDALLPIFLAMVPLAVFALIFLLFIVENPLATSVNRKSPVRTNTQEPAPTTGRITMVTSTATSGIPVLDESHPSHQTKE